MRHIRHERPQVRGRGWPIAPAMSLGLAVTAGLLTGCDSLLDVDLPDKLLRHVQDLSLAAHRALGCRTFSRADFMVDGRKLEPYLLEVNTIPGFTSHSLFPKAAKRAGLSFAQFCQRIVTMSVAGEGER